MAAVEKVRILVVGDSGVGKTSLVNLMCHDESISSPAWTIGCTVEVKLYDYKERNPGARTVFLEFWDVGGSANHRNTRSIFYSSVNGLILVHDLTNRKSTLNLRKWLAEVLNAGKENGTVKCNDNLFDLGFKESTDDFDPEQFAGNQVPILIVGTKLDQGGTARASQCVRGLAEEVGADIVSLDCRDAKQLKEGSPNNKKLKGFFDKVIERRFYARDILQGQFNPSHGYQESGRYFDRSSKRKLV